MRHVLSMNVLARWNPIFGTTHRKSNKKAIKKSDWKAKIRARFVKGPTCLSFLRHVLGGRLICPSNSSRLLSHWRYPALISYDFRFEARWLSWNHESNTHKHTWIQHHVLMAAVSTVHIWQDPNSVTSNPHYTSLSTQPSGWTPDDSKHRKFLLVIFYVPWGVRCAFYFHLKCALILSESGQGMHYLVTWPGGMMTSDSQRRCAEERMPAPRTLRPVVIFRFPWYFVTFFRLFFYFSVSGNLLGYYLCMYRDFVSIGHC